MAQIDLRNSIITIWDGTPSVPKYIEIKIGEGNLTYTEDRNIDFVKRRGVLTTVREGDEQQMGVQLSFVWEYITSVESEPPTVENALKKTGTASSWMSTSPDSKAPFCVNIQVDYRPPCLGTNAWERIVFPEFHYNKLAHSLKDGTVDLNGFCNRTKASPTRYSPPS